MNFTNDPTPLDAAELSVTTEGDVSLGGDQEASVVLWPRQIAIPLYRYSAYIILAIGIPGNILTLIVLNSKAYNYSLSTISLNVLAVADLFALFTLIIHSLQHIWDVPLLTQFSGTCKIFTYLRVLAPKVASMVLTVIMIERAVSVSFPLHAKTLITERRLLAAHFFILAFFLLYYLPILLYHQVIIVDGWPECQSVNYPRFLDFFYPWSTALFEVFIPVVVILNCSAMIIFKVRKAHHA